MKLYPSIPNAKVIAFDPHVLGTRPKDNYPSGLLDYMRHLLIETARSLVWREQRGTITSPELYVLAEIREFWPSWFDDESPDRISEIVGPENV